MAQLVRSARCDARLELRQLIAAVFPRPGQAQGGAHASPGAALLASLPKPAAVT
ncbi:hypothetical protein D3C76_1851960 [compost metagenome]